MNLSCFKKIYIALGMCAAMVFGANVSAQNYRLPGQHTEQSENLMANQIMINNNALLDQNFNYDLFDEEEEPEGDLYELGWDSGVLHCYNGVTVPDQVEIDVRNFHMPHAGYMTSPYGYRARFKRMHKGVDLHVNVGDTVYAAFDGRVRLTKYEARGYGYYVVLRHYNDLETVYGHLSKFLVENDEYVKAGTPIALAGNTGRSTGPHLHFETRYMGYAINPAGIFDFVNQTTHTDTYTFDKKTYQQARNFSPEANSEYAKEYLKANPRKAAPASSKSSGKSGKSGKSSPEYITVKSGDSLGRIANRYHTTVSALCKLNNLTTKSVIKPGQKIRVR